MNKAFTISLLVCSSLYAGDFPSKKVFFPIPLMNMHGYFEQVDELPTEYKDQLTTHLDDDSKVIKIMVHARAAGYAVVQPKKDESSESEIKCLMEEGHLEKGIERAVKHAIQEVLANQD